MMQDQTLVLSKHYLVEMKDKPPGDKQVVGNTSKNIIQNKYSVLCEVVPYIADYRGLATQHVIKRICQHIMLA